VPSPESPKTKMHTSINNPVYSITYVKLRKISVTGKFCSRLNRNQDGAHSPLQQSDKESDITQKGGGMWRSKFGVAEKKDIFIFQ